MKSKVLIADDHPIVLDGIEAVLRGTDFRVVARCVDGSAVIKALSDLRPDILILDVRMPPPGGVEILKSLQTRKQAKVILLTASISDSEALEAISLGVGGIVLKETAPHQLLDAIFQVERGGRWFDPDILQRALIFRATKQQKLQPADRALTARELVVVRLVARGLRNREIAEQISITEGTVKMHLHNVYNKLGIESRTELAIFVRDHNLG